MILVCSCQLPTINLDSFSWIGITDEIFRKFGHLPSENDMLNKLERGMDIDSLMDFISCCGILLGPVLLLVSILDMMSWISIGQVGFIMKEEVFGFCK